MPHAWRVGQHGQIGERHNLGGHPLYAHRDDGVAQGKHRMLQKAKGRCKTNPLSYLWFAIFEHFLISIMEGRTKLALICGHYRKQSMP